MNIRHFVSFILLFFVVVNSDEFHPRKKKLVHSRSNPPGMDHGLHKIPFADWKRIARDTLERKLLQKQNMKKAKNMILFIGDGMGVSTTTVARLHKSQKENITLDEVHLAWDVFPYLGHVKTYNSDVMVPDSAGTATAFMCGEKTRSGVIGMDQMVPIESNCSQYTENDCVSSLHDAIDAGKWTGVISNHAITGATPAAAYAHSPDRGWQGDQDIPAELRGHCEDIAHQLVYQQKNQDIRVLLGGGRRYFYTTSDEDPEHTTTFGQRMDVNLKDEWLRMKQASGLEASEYQYVYRQEEFDAVNPDTIKYLLGLFEPSSMNYEVNRKSDVAGEPSLAELTEKAIRLLQNSQEGFFLYVENGQTDSANHANKAHLLATEVWALSDAVQRAIDLTDPEDTLIVVSADHSHTLTVNGYPHLDSDIYGPSWNEDGELNIGADGLPWPILSYGTGPGGDDHRNLDNSRVNLTGVPKIVYDSIDYRQASLIPRSSGTHAGEEVGVWANGPWSHLFSGTLEQNFLATAMRHASCIHPDLQGDHCQQDSSKASELYTLPTRYICALSMLVLVLIQQFA